MENHAKHRAFHKRPSRDFSVGSEEQTRAILPSANIALNQPPPSATTALPTDSTDSQPITIGCHQRIGTAIWPHTKDDRTNPNSPGPLGSSRSYGKNARTPVLNRDNRAPKPCSTSCKRSLQDPKRARPDPSKRFHARCLEARAAENSMFVGQTSYRSAVKRGVPGLGR